MKSSIRLRHFLALAASSLMAISSATAQVYWDTNGSTPGFGTAGGTWGTNAFWNTDGTGGAGTFNTTNATTFPVNFGNEATGLGAGAISVGTVTSGDMTFASGSGAITLSGGTITLPAAATITGNNTTNTINSILGGAGTSLTKLGTGTLILSGANSYTGTTNINLGTVQVNSGGTLGDTTAALNMGTGSDGVLGDAANLTLNTSATVGAFTVKSNTSDTTTASNINQLSIASGSTLSAASLSVGVAVGNSSTNVVNTALSTGSTPGAGGTLTVTGNTRVGLQGSNAASGDPSTSMLDLRGLHTFNSGQLLVGNEKNSKATVYLANNANTINGSTISVGDSSGTDNYNLAGVSQLFLGAGTNKLQATNLLIGKVKGAGQILFAGSSGSVEITGLNGSGTANITLGDHTTSSYQGGAANSLLLAGHAATVSAGTVILGQLTSNNAAGGNTLDSVLTFDTGTFNASTIEMGKITSTNVTGSHATNSTFTIGGDTANSAATGIVNVSGNILLGNHDSVYAGATSATMIINGGTVNVNVTTPTATEGIFDSSATASNSPSTLTLAGGTLNLNGGRIGGTGTESINSLNFRSGTLMNVASINGSGGLTKTTGGTLTLAGTNSYSGATTIEAGTLALGANDALPTTSVIIGAGTLDAATYIDTTGTLDVTDTSSTINLGSGAVLSFAASNGVDWTGGTLNITGSFVSGVSLRFGTSITGLTSGPSSQLAAISAAGFTNFALNSSGYLIADVDGDGAPEIAVNQGGNIESGGSRSFGTVTLGGTPASLVFTINNIGTAALNLTGTPRVAVSGTNVADFTVTSQPAASVAASGNTTFTVQFAPLGSTSGTRNAVLTIANNDSNEGSFTVNVSGSAQTPYQAWSGGAAFDTDTNGDGVKNGMAFLLGALSPTSAVTVPTVTQTSGNLVLSFNMLKPANRGSATLSVQHSRDLGIGDAWATVPVTDSNSGPTNGVTFVVGSGGGTTNPVTATISASEAGGTGKLFGRLRAAQP